MRPKDKHYLGCATDNLFEPKRELNITEDDHNKDQKTDNMMLPNMF